jgi:hypothetical protein
MTRQKPRQTVQHCPVCGVAMLGSKSNENSADFDTFTCLTCDTVITLTPPSKANRAPS